MKHLFTSYCAKDLNM